MESQTKDSAPEKKDMKNLRLFYWERKVYTLGKYFGERTSKKWQIVNTVNKESFSDKEMINNRFIF